jgi:hypothetical protein
MCWCCSANLRAPLAVTQLEQAEQHMLANEQFKKVMIDFFNITHV